MTDHQNFTTAEATTTEAGRIRGVILDEIATRVGQVPDLHPRLLEGIEVAARTLAAATEVVADEAAATGTIPAPVLDAAVAGSGTAPDVIEIAPDVIGDYYDDQTLTRVHDVLAAYGLNEVTRTEMIGRFQNAGILFRERGPIAVQEQAPGTINAETPHRA